MHWYGLFYGLGDGECQHDGGEREERVWPCCATRLVISGCHALEKNSIIFITLFNVYIILHSMRAARTTGVKYVQEQVKYHKAAFWGSCDYYFMRVITENPKPWYARIHTANQLSKRNIFNSLLSSITGPTKQKWEHRHGAVVKVSIWTDRNNVSPSSRFSLLPRVSKFNKYIPVRDYLFLNVIQNYKYVWKTILFYFISMFSCLKA